MTKFFSSTLLTVLISCISIAAFGQIEFKKGYFIDNEGNKSDVYIKDIGWKNNPDSFEYKKEIDGEVKTATIENISVFQIEESTRFERHTVDIDQSGSRINNLSNQRAPEWQNETLFLKVLVQGHASLLYLEEENLFRYFYTIDGKPVKQLISKEYRSSSSQILGNHAYLNQLFMEVRCGDTSEKDIKQVDYKKKPLIKYFTEFNECHGNESIVYSDKSGGDKVYFRLNVGINSSHTSIATSIRGYGNADFGGQISPRAGFEIEYVPPFNNSKWGLLAETAYQSFNGETVFDNGTPVEISYKSIELSIGLRHYFYLNDNSRIFLNGHLISNFSLQLDGEVKYGEVDLEIKPQNSWSAGLGYMIGRFSIEGRVAFKRNILSNYYYWRSDHHRFSAIAAFRL